MGRSPGPAKGPATPADPARVAQLAGARCHQGRSAGVGNSRDTGRQAHRGRRPRRGQAGTRSCSSILRKTPPRPRGAAGRAGRGAVGVQLVWGTGALQAQEWAVRPRSPLLPPDTAGLRSLEATLGAQRVPEHSEVGVTGRPSLSSQSCRAGRPGGTGRNPTTEARLPPEHVDVTLGTVLGIVDQGGTHSLPAALSPTACWGPSIAGKEAGLMVLSRGNLPRKDSPSANQPPPPLASISPTWFRAKQMRAVQDLTAHTYEQSHSPEVKPRTESRRA